MGKSFDRELTEEEKKWFAAAQVYKRPCQEASVNTDGEYYCTRQEGHDGPCAAVPDRKTVYHDTREVVAPVDSKIAAAAMKVPLELIPLKALKGAARVFGYGKKKHGHGNFHNAHLDDGAADRYVGGFLRHLADSQLANGKYTAESIAHLDVESGLPEIDHAICGLIMLRAIAVKSGALPEDPGTGNEPPK